MGMFACYMEAKYDLIESLKTKSDNELFEEVESLLQQNIKSYDMGKLWDGLHFIMTGVSASTPIVDDLLSEAIVGTSMFSSDENANYIAYIYPDRVREIFLALSSFDIYKALSYFSPKELEKKDIYPSIWVESEKESLKEELISEFKGIKDFYGVVSNDNKGIVVSIY